MKNRKIEPVEPNDPPGNLLEGERQNLDFREAVINLLKAMGIEKLVIKLNNLLTMMNSYKIPILYKNNRIGTAIFNKDKMPKYKNGFRVFLDLKCKGNFDKNIVKDYKIVKIILLDNK